MPVTITATCNRDEQPCGCSSWLQLDPESGEWARRYWTCSGHETAARGSAA